MLITQSLDVHGIRSGKNNLHSHKYLVYIWLHLVSMDLHLFQKARPNTTSCFRRLRRQGRLEGITHAHLAYLAGTKLIDSNHNHHSK